MKCTYLCMTLNFECQGTSSLGMLLASNVTRRGLLMRFSSASFLGDRLHVVQQLRSHNLACRRSCFRVPKLFCAIWQSCLLRPCSYMSSRGHESRDHGYTPISAGVIYGLRYGSSRGATDVLKRPRERNRRPNAACAVAT